MNKEKKRRKTEQGKKVKVDAEQRHSIIEQRIEKNKDRTERDKVDTEQRQNRARQSVIGQKRNRIEPRQRIR